MKKKVIKILGILFLALLPFVFSSCQPESDTSADWEGNWRTTEAGYAGTIKINPNNKREIIISGELFGLNSSFEVVASVNGSSATYDRIGDFRIKGTATLANSKQMKLSFTIISDGESNSYTHTAIKI